ncbi:MAG: hypothetical protein DHS20C15_29910 [Planctomycetota bacterium]|nr:MAG: hypothetical protein DHS20C15_29910 [Planctomycetota bacterium]
MKSKLLIVLETAARQTVGDKVLTYAAALAFYTALSLPPLLVILLWVLGGISDDASEHLRSEAELLMGGDGAAAIDSILDNAENRVDLSGLSGLISTLALIFAATGVFSRLQAALNEIWEVRPKGGVGIWVWLRKRMLSLGLLGVVSFLMLVSLAASTFLGMLDVSTGAGLLAASLNTLFTVVVFTLLFAAVYRLLPDVDMRWSDVWGGALLTACLFGIGKWCIGAYLSHRGLGGQYGVAGSAIVLLVWVYFSAILVLVGAELTQAWLAESGRVLEPNEHAERKPRHPTASDGD